MRIPVYQLKSEIPYPELLGWFEYFKLRPPGWQEDNRTALLMKAFGVKEKPEEIFPSLKAISDAKHKREQAPNFGLQFMQRFGHKFPELTVEE